MVATVAMGAWLSSSQAPSRPEPAKFDPVLLLLIQALYILFWTWLLNLICKVNKGISWIIVLFPFILFFLALGIILFQGIQQDRLENFGELSQYTI
jgi:hypothetical protein